MARLPPQQPRVVRVPLARRVSLERRAGISSTRCASWTAQAEPAFKASGDITSMAHADGYIEIAADVAAVEAGTVVDVVLF